MDTCVRCGAELGVGRFCLNCGHPIGEPAPAPSVPPEPAAPVTEAPAHHVEPLVLPVQAADTVPAPPVTLPVAAPAPPSTPATGATTGTPDATTAGTGTETPAAEPEPAPVAAPDPRVEWDPQLELLPYEEVDDPGSDTPLPARAWIAWVAGALLLVGLVLVLLQVLGTDGEDATASDPGTSESSAPAPDEGSASPDEGSSDGEDAAPTGVGKRLDLATGATVAVPDTAPPTTDLDGNLVAYEAAQMVDGNPATTWRTAGDATGQTITLTLPEPGVVSRVGLVNGYSKQVAGVDWYPNNRRILAVTWGFDDGTTVDQTFAERPGLQRLKVPPVETATVTITITSVTPPGSGNLGRDYTAISEVSIIGRRAG